MCQESRSTDIQPFAWVGSHQLQCSTVTNKTNFELALLTAAFYSLSAASVYLATFHVMISPEERELARDLKPLQSDQSCSSSTIFLRANVIDL